MSEKTEYLTRCPWCDRIKEPETGEWAFGRPLREDKVTDGICPECYAVEQRKLEALKRSR